MPYETIKEKKPPLVIIAGPTAVGKTAVSVRLAQAFAERGAAGEIISADSIQVYRGLDIGSAKVKQEEMCGIRHHLIDAIAPDVMYDAASFQQMADAALRDIYARGHTPIVAGGTGFYIQALLYGVDFSEEGAEKPALRAALEAEAETKEGALALYERLCACDPLSGERIHPNNTKRVIRALEYYMLHQTPISQHNDAERRREARFDAAFFVLTDERARLYERIDRRVDMMLAEGLVDEVKALRALGLTARHTAMQGIGYKEINAYLDGACTLAEAVELIKKNSRNYAKRQLTWFRREKDVVWVDVSEFDYDKEEIVKWIMKQCMNRWA